jgi:formylglycine-generating enzyme required for sulfatase activity/tetratricopeptide (TPR) repeat protein
LILVALTAVLGSFLRFAIATDRRDEDPPNATLRQVVVVPFRAEDADGPLAPLGREIADRVTDRLNAVENISAPGGNIVHQEAHDDGLQESNLKPPDALGLAKRLGADLLVEGTFKKDGETWQVECSIVDVETGQVLGGKSLPVAARGPEGYASILRELPEQIAEKLKPAGAVASSIRGDALKEPKEVEVHELLAAGLQKSAAGNPEDLQSAKEAFRQALAKDADYAEALIAKSDTETRLCGIKKTSGQDAAEEQRSAVEDALTAVRCAPYYGAAHAQLAKILTLTGDYKGAALAAKLATLLWPSNGSTHLDLSRALSQGKIVDGPEFQRAIHLTPSVALVVPEMPKVRVVNDKEGVLEFTFKDENGSIFAIVDVPPGGSRMVGLLSGHYSVTSRRKGGDATEPIQHEFGAGTRYALNDRTLVFETSATTAQDNASTSVTVTCPVAGAMVSIDGIEIGPAPIKRSVDPTVAHTTNFKIEVKAPGFKIYGTEAHSDPGKPVEVIADMVPAIEEGNEEAAAGKSHVDPFTGIEEVFIPGGMFTLGETDQPDNQPHTVTLDSYYISKTPVTARQYFKFLHDLAHLPKDEYSDFEPFDRAKTPPWGWDNDDHPMVGITWAQARAYCHYAGGRLPTEDQWEHAARGKDNLVYPWGNTFEPDRLQWSEGRAGSAIKTALVTAHPTGASPYGLLDMAGNVWQWCNDPHRSPIPGNPYHRVVGGSWKESDKDVFRCSHRQLPPNDPFTIGFRVVFPVTK